MHIHPHLTLYVSGHKVAVPAQIGIDPALYRDHHLDKYIGDMGAAPIHTHDSSGILHVESSVTRKYTLGEFLKIWGVDLSGHKVSVTADGHAVAAYKRLVLKDGEDIVMKVK